MSHEHHAMDHDEHRMCHPKQPMKHIHSGHGDHMSMIRDFKTVLDFSCSYSANCFFLNYPEIFHLRLLSFRIDMYVLFSCHLFFLWWLAISQRFS